MLEQDLVELVKSLKSSLSKPGAARSPEETRAAIELCRLCEPIIRARIWRVPAARNEIDDIAQNA